MNTRPPPKRDPPIVAEEIGFDDVEEISDDDLTPEEIAELESNLPVVSMTRSIIPSVKGVDPDVDLQVDRALEAITSADEEEERPTDPPPPHDLDEAEFQAFMKAAYGKQKLPGS